MNNRRRAFTLIELLVAIVIIVILVGITIPVVSKVRQSAYAASSGALVQSLNAAIQQYQQQFNAYPGPIPDNQIGPGGGVAITNLVGGQVTGTENLVLGLLGGLKWDTATGSVAFDWATVGQGPRNLSPRLPQKKAALMDPRDLSWTDSQPGIAPNEPGPESGYFGDEVSSARALPGGAIDSNVPEFVDRFPSPMPVLYLRARVGATGVVSIRDMTSGGAPANPDAGGTPRPTQYDISQILGYTRPDGSNVSIGVGKKLDGYYAGSDTPTPSAAPYHGLRSVDPATSMTSPGPTYYYPADAYPYFVNPSVPNTPRQKDAFILISAGKDRVYGTEDDITNFGPVMPNQ